MPPPASKLRAFKLVPSERKHKLAIAAGAACPIGRCDPGDGSQGHLQTAFCGSSSGSFV